MQADTWGRRQKAEHAQRAEHDTKSFDLGGLGPVLAFR